MNYFSEREQRIIQAIRERASIECETQEEFAQAEADRDSLLALLGYPIGDTHNYMGGIGVA